MFEYIRIAVAVPNVSVANVTYNVNEIIKKATEADKENADIVLFPELAITGYTAGDLFFQKTLMEENTNGLKEIIKASKNLKSVIAVGLPIEVKGRLYNAAAIIYGGKLYGVVPKTFTTNFTKEDGSLPVQNSTSANLRRNILIYPIFRKNPFPSATISYSIRDILDSARKYAKIYGRRFRRAAV